jgi:hypothetical protein
MTGRSTKDTTAKDDSFGPPEWLKPLVQATRQFLERFAIPDSPFDEFSRGYLSGPIRRLQSALEKTPREFSTRIRTIVLDQISEPISSADAECDISLSIPGPLEWSSAVIRDEFRAILSRWEHEQDKFNDARSDYYRPLGLRGDESSEEEALAWAKFERLADERGVPEPVLPARTFTADESSTLTHALAVLSDCMDVDTLEHLCTNNELLSMSRSELNRLLGKSRGYSDYLERAERDGRIEWIEKGKRLSIRIIDPGLLREVQARLKQGAASNSV